jgi:hypothetical protein
MIIAPRPLNLLETLEAIREPGREQARIYKEWFPNRFGSWFYGIPTWTLAGAFIATMIALVATAQAWPALTRVLFIASLAEVVALYTGSFIASIEACVCCIRALLRSDEIKARMAPVIDRVTRALRGSDYLKAERLQYKWLRACLAIPGATVALLSGYLVHEHVLTVQNFAAIFESDVLRFAAIIVATVYFAGSVACFQVWSARLYVLNVAIGDDGGKDVNVFGIIQSFVVFLKG